MMNKLFTHPAATILMLAGFAHFFGVYGTVFFCWLKDRKKIPVVNYTVYERLNLSQMERGEFPRQKGED